MRLILFLSIYLLMSIPILSTKTNSLLDIEGEWEKSEGNWIPLYSSLSTEFKCENSNCSEISILQHYGSGKYMYENNWENLKIGVEKQMKIKSRIFPTNIFIGLEYYEEDIKTITLKKIEKNMKGKIEVLVEEKKPIQGSQGTYDLTVLHSFIYIEEKGEKRIEYYINRSSRKKSVFYLLKEKAKPIMKKSKKKKKLKKDNPKANLEKEKLPELITKANRETVYFAEIGYDYDWTLEGTVDEKALLISIAGIVNQNKPNLYLLYPKNFTFTFTHEIMKFMNEYHYNFQKLETIQQILDLFHKEINGYIIWDTKIRTSISVAYTLAGLKKAVVISERLIPLLKKYQIPLLHDFRDQFVGQSDLQIYQWSYYQYFNQCNKKYIIWLGGECGKQVVPGVADFGIAQGAFFTDLSTRKTSEEYALANKILREMDNPITIGWHSYCKDLEREFCTLSSNNQGLIHGLNSFPNLSFGNKVPLTKNFVFKNNHAQEEIEPEDNLIYIAAKQTDGLGLGSWVSPSRGLIPYAWETTPLHLDLFPGLIEMFYRDATPNDFFIATPVGYMYPKAFPFVHLKENFEESRRLMKLLDLNVMSFMDYSEGSTIVGNTDLTKEILDLYYETVPESIGSVNGYAPSYTFGIYNNSKPTISYDYYLDLEMDDDEVIQDLYELATINSIRPFFIVFHVREYSTVERVKGIFDKLGKEFKLVHLDTLLKMSGKKFTFKERYKDGR